MSTRKEIEIAMNGGETAPELQLQQEYQPEALLKKDTTPVNDEFYVFKLVNTNRQGGVYIPGIDYVIDPRSITDEKPDGDGPEMIRLLTGVPTIWVKEQRNITEDYIKRNTRDIRFPKGTRFISVPAYDKTQLAFMEVCRHNIRNPNRKTGSKFEFFRYDPNEVAKAQLAKEMLEIDMITKASQQKPEKMLKHAAYLGINLIDEIGRKKPDDRLRTDYILTAKRDPETFKKSLDSKEVDIQYKIRAAIIDGKIDISRGDGKAYYGNGGGLICSIPKTENPLQFLTSLATTPNAEGKDFIEQLQALST
jgi:hypothetical protein